MKFLYLLAVLILGATWGGTQATSASESQALPTPPVDQPPTAEPVAVRVSAISGISIPASISYRRMDELVVMWKVGAACSGAGASVGEFDHVDIKEFKNDVIVTLYLKNAVVNPKPRPHRNACLVHIPTNVRLVPLARPLGKRIVHDWACPGSCRVRKFSKADQQDLLARLR